jgi:hypothetical protein
MLTRSGHALVAPTRYLTLRPLYALTEFGKAIGRGQGQEVEQSFQRECVRAEADFASHCKYFLSF